MCLRPLTFLSAYDKMRYLFLAPLNHYEIPR